MSSNSPQGDRGSGRTGSEPKVDGRHQRSLRSRERILAALEEALTEPDLVLNPEQIAARAGVSLSTVFRHFGDLAGVARAMRERVEARVDPYMTAGPIEGELRERVRGLVQRLTTAYEILAPFYRVTVRDPTRGPEARGVPLELGQAARQQVLGTLGPELAGDPDAEIVVCTLLSFDAWDHLRSVRGIPPERAAALLEGAVLALLGS